ncbi:MAG TPA: alpha/beta hydrolase [Steroidobacteraceae bacterium]|nr:alpha/beta hydrolase [Steroidobacteraceae bacterium]
MSGAPGKYRPRRVPRHEQRLVRDLRHRVTWWGPPSANPIVLLHGWGDSAETWQFLVDELPDEWPCVALDWRGFGGTEWARHGYWFPDYFADLEAFLAQVCPRTPARLIAHSMGGNVATMYAGIRPARIEWIVNLEGIGLPRTHPDQAPERYAEWLDQLRTPPRERRYPNLDVLVDFLIVRNPGIPRERAEYLARAWSALDESGDGALKLTFDPRHRNVNPVLFQRPEAEACWKRCTAPVLLVLGGRSSIRTRVAPEDVTSEYFRALFRDIRIELLANAGHMMHIEDPAAIARLTLEFARAHAGTTVAHPS